MKIEKATLCRAEMLDNLLVFKANYQRFRFSRHAHEDFALGLMEGGTQRFHCCGEENNASPGSLISVNAGEIHDGMSADGNAYRYRIIYIPDELLQQVGGEMVASGERYLFSRPVVEDADLACRLAVVFRLLEDGEAEDLHVQSLFYGMVADLLRRHGRAMVQKQRLSAVPSSIDRACEFINDKARKNITLDDIAKAAGLSRYHFLRVFSHSRGMTPHSFLLLRRLQLARAALRKGASIADAAVGARFADQSHFTRRFKAAYGITPRQFKQAVC